MQESLDQVINLNKVKLATEHYAKLQNLSQSVVMSTFCEVLQEQLHTLGSDYDLYTVGYTVVLYDKVGHKVEPSEVILDDPYNFIHDVQRELLERLKHLKLHSLANDRFNTNMVIDVTVIKKLRGSLIGSYSNQEIMMSESDMVHIDRIVESDVVKVVIKKISIQKGHVKVACTRRGNRFVKLLLEEIIPEIAEGQIKITGIYRQEGVKTYVLVSSNDERMTQPVKVCIGIKASRSKTLKRHLTEHLEFKQTPELDEDGLRGFCEEVFREQFFFVKNDTIHLQRGDRLQHVPEIELNMISNLWTREFKCVFVEKDESH